MLQPSDSGPGSSGPITSTPRSSSSSTSVVARCRRRRPRVVQLLWISRSRNDFRDSLHHRLPRLDRNLNRRSGFRLNTGPVQRVLDGREPHRLALGTLGDPQQLAGESVAGFLKSLRALRFTCGARPPW